MGKTLLAALALTLGAALAHAEPNCRAVDGDTIQCGRERIRLRNVYAAELTELGGADARERMAQLQKAGDVTFDRRAHDPRGRTLAYVFVDGRRIEQADIGPRGGRGIKPRLPKSS